MPSRLEPGGSRVFGEVLQQHRDQYLVCVHRPQSCESKGAENDEQQPTEATPGRHELPPVRLGDDRAPVPSEVAHQGEHDQSHPQIGCDPQSEEDDLHRLEYDDLDAVGQVAIGLQQPPDGVSGGWIPTDESREEHRDEQVEPAIQVPY